MHRKILYGLAMLLFAAAEIGGCASESHRTLQVSNSANAASGSGGPQCAVVVGVFDNRSGYMQGMFSDGDDRLGGQAKTLLVADLQQSGRFAVAERDNLDQLAREAGFKSEAQHILGAEFALTGDVVEFGRKETGDTELFGILGSGKQQTAYAKVTINVVSVKTSRVVYSAQGAGEYTLSNREIIGTGGAAGYDSTLNGKVLSLAIAQAVDRLAEGLEQGQWGANP